MLVILMVVDALLDGDDLPVRAGPDLVLYERRMSYCCLICENLNYRGRYYDFGLFAAFTLTAREHRVLNAGVRHALHPLP